MNILTIKIDSDINRKHIIQYFDIDSGTFRLGETIDELELYRYIRNALKVRMESEHNRILERMKK